MRIINDYSNVIDSCEVESIEFDVEKCVEYVFNNCNKKLLKNEDEYKKFVCKEFDIDEEDVEDIEIGGGEEEIDFGLMVMGESYKDEKLRYVNVCVYVFCVEEGWFEEDIKFVF